jgi:hypothetical protein
MKRNLLAGFTGLSLLGVGGYVTCSSAADCEDPGYLTVSVVQADGTGFAPVKVANVEYVVDADPREEGGAAGEQLAAAFSADCIDAGCTKWRAAPGENGEVTVRTQVCGETFENVALVDRDENGCSHGDRELQLVVDQSACADGGQGPGDITTGEKACTMENRPSVQLYAWRQHDDYFSPTSLESVHYDYKGKVTESKPPAAACMDDRCTSWNIGAEMKGVFEIHGTSCDETQTVRVVVPKTADDCHVETQRVDMVVTGTGCLAAFPTVPHNPPLPPKDGPETDVDPPGGKLTDKPDDGPPGPDDGVGDVDPVGKKLKDKPSGTTPAPDPGSQLAPGCSKDMTKESAFRLHFVTLHGDMYVPVETESMSYTVEGKQRRWVATCSGEPCSTWEGESRGPGRYTVATTMCGKEAKLTFDVAPGADGCGVDTQYLMWEADKTGCLAVPGSHTDKPGSERPLKDPGSRP